MKNVFVQCWIFSLVPFTFLWMSNVMVTIESQMGFINFLYLEMMISINWSLQIDIKLLGTGFSRAHKTPLLHQRLQYLWQTIPSSLSFSRNNYLIKCEWWPLLVSMFIDLCSSSNGDKTLPPSPKLVSTLLVLPLVFFYFVFNVNFIIFKTSHLSIVVNFMKEMSFTFNVSNKLKIVKYNTMIIQKVPCF